MLLKPPNSKSITLEKIKSTQILSPCFRNSYCRQLTSYLGRYTVEAYRLGVSEQREAYLRHSIRIQITCF